MFQRKNIRSAYVKVYVTWFQEPHHNRDSGWFAGQGGGLLTIISNSSGKLMFLGRVYNSRFGVLGSTT